MEMHDPVAIANRFIGLNSSEKGFTLMQLLKLSYIAHGFKLGLLEEPLSNEFVQAWKFGPVFPSIYDKFKYQISDILITEPAKGLNSNGLFESVCSIFTKQEEQIIDSVYEIYGKIDGWKLSALTHQEGTPWHKAWYDGGGADGFKWVTIKNEEIKKHFKECILSKNKN